MGIRKLNNSNRLREVRNEQKITQKKLADLSGFSQSAIATYENGTRSISDEVDRILSKLLHVDSLLIKQEDSTNIAMTNLLSYQAQNGLSNKKLAEMLNVSTSLLSRVIGGKRKVTEDFLKKVEDVLINNASELLMNINQPDGSFCFPILDRHEMGNRIHQIRKNREETLEKFGKNLTQIAGKNVVARWENGINIPDIERLMNIAAIGNTSATYLIYGDSFASMLEVGKTVKKFEKLERCYFGLRLRKIRKASGMGRHDFGQFFNPPITKWSMDRYENGKDIPNTERVIQYAYIGKVSLEFLIYGK